MARLAQAYDDLHWPGKVLFEIPWLSASGFWPLDFWAALKVSKVFLYLDLKIKKIEIISQLLRYFECLRWYLALAWSLDFMIWESLVILKTDLIFFKGLEQSKFL
jgi:hypothetical protein